MDGPIWLLKAGVGDKAFVAPRGLKLRVGMFEVGLDFDVRVLRFGLRPPKGRDKEQVSQVSVKAWRDLSLASKITQLHSFRGGALVMPPLPRDWGAVQSLEGMPCVVWVLVPRQR